MGFVLVDELSVRKWRRCGLGFVCGLKQEPYTALSLVERIFDQAGGCHIDMPIADFIAVAKHSDEFLIVGGQQSPQMAVR